LLSISKNSLITFATQVAYFAITFVSGVIIARVLGPAGKGIYSLTILTYNLTVIIAGLGIPIFNACVAGKKKYSVDSLLSNSLVLTLTVTVLLGLACGAVYSQRNIFFQDVQWQYVVFAFAVAPLGLFTESLRGVLQGLNRIKEFNMTRLIAPAANTLALIVLLAVLGLGIGWALLSWAISLVVGLTVAIIVISGLASIRLMYNPGLLRESVTFGLQAWLAQIIGTLQFRFDVFLVGYFLGAADVGYYTVALAIAEFIFYIPAAIGTAALPRMAVADDREAARIACLGCRNAFFLSVLVALCLFATGRFLTELVYSPAYLPAVEPLLILLPGVTILSMAHITTGYYNGHVGKPWINTALASVSLTVNTLLDLLLIPQMGIRGAALASTVTYITVMGVAVIVFTRVAKTRIVDMLVIRPNDFHPYLALFNALKARGQAAVKP
jgi:O-antigen/teichoic acid export membrane protein